MPKTFEPGKNAQQLGIDVTRKFVVVNWSKDCTFNEGAVLTLKTDDKTDFPFFTDTKSGRCGPTRWARLAYADEEKLAVHVPTREQYDALMAAYERKGWKWMAGQKPTEYDGWSFYGKEMHVSFKDGFKRHSTEGGNANGWKDITFDEAMRRLGEPVEEKRPMSPVEEACKLQTVLNQAVETIIGEWKITPYPWDVVKVQTTFNQPKPTLMENIVQKIKDLALSKEDRALRADGFEDQCGKMTNMAREMMLAELVEERWAERRSDVAKSLIEIGKEAE